MRDVLRLAGVLMLISALSGGALFVAYRLTSPRIGAETEARKQEALKQVLPAASGFIDRTGDARRLLTQPEFADVREVWEGRSLGTRVGWGILVAPRGYGGPVVTLVGVEAGGRVAGVRVVSASHETPGLGTRVGEPAFLAQFRGLKPPPLVVVRSRPEQRGEVQAVTGATVSSRAVAQAVLVAAGLAERLGRQ
ncbi:MAG: RnfABCDGE type electron transport complex subunit G [Acetobacteraceae bacterium]|nr:RnfABCDGE type electron transport complex subunit G [Acetobacteraceae bacterium]